MVQKIQLTKGMFALVDDEDFLVLNQYKWVYEGGYAVRDTYITLFGVKIRHHRFMHREIFDLPYSPRDKIFVDHIDHNKLNNQKSNLRLVTRSLNGLNRKLNKDNTTGYKGVSLHKPSGLYIAAITINQKVKVLKYSKNPKEAAEAYDKYIEEHYPEYGLTNKILGLL